MRFNVHQIDEPSRRLARQRLVQTNGCAAAVMHGLYFGATPDERTRELQRIMERQPEAPPGTFERVWGHQDEYLEGLAHVITHGAFRGGVGLLFESVTQLDHVPYIEAANPELLWLVVETVHKSAHPQHASWSDVIESLTDLGLRHAIVAGCYGVTGRDNQLVSPEVYYACVNDLVWQLRDSGKLERVDVAGRAVFGQDLDMLLELKARGITL
jgi:hypothetical protein